MKKMLALVLTLMLVMTAVSFASAEAQKAFNIGVTIPDLSNPIWAEVCKSMEDTAAAVGSTATVVDCANDASKQISQIENYIIQGVDAIIIGASDAASLDDVCQKALDAGIVVMAYGINLKNYTISLTNDNAGAGKLIGEMAAKFINETHAGKAEVGLITYYENEECLKRGKSMVEALAANCPGAEVVKEASSVVADTGMTYTENFLQSNPDMKVIMSIGDGAAIGANQAVKAAGKAEGFGIYAVDGTIEALQLMANGDPIKAEVSFGAGWQLGAQAMNVCMSALTTTDFVKDNFTPNIVVTMENLKEKIVEWGYEDQIDLSKMQ